MAVDVCASLSLYTVHQRAAATHTVHLLPQSITSIQDKERQFVSIDRDALYILSI
ncbi:hypothetical protein M378DRAFT_171972 [Amanita muscaria Koide BX008]|uniref:Uncharacterized protein n=1 Tax=Amanita muscaria (strain Koide BX008) TaxID=946122 RepID=A0A0C2WM09_AMAMK|nr:hypothetical protein M378DRAFT_171972 [Amanita muscaria Koide BX008]